MSAKYSPDSSSDSISAEIDLTFDDFSDGATGDEEFDSDTLYSSSSDISAADTEFSLLLSPDLYRALNVTGAMPKKARFATPLSRKRTHPNRSKYFFPCLESLSRSISCSVWFFLSVVCNYSPFTSCYLF